MTDNPLLNRNKIKRTTINESAVNVGVDPFHIAFGVDRTFFRAMGVCISSIAENNPGIPLVFHIFTSMKRLADQPRLEALAVKYNLVIHIYQFSTTLFHGLPTFERFSSAIYNRLIIPEILRDVAERVLYLDSDIVCLGDISELMTMNLQNRTVGAVPDHDPKTNQYKVASLHLKFGGYFNSGFLLIDLDRWNRENILSKALSILGNKELPLNLPDQDALNVTLDGQALSVEEKWNTLYSMLTMHHEIPDDTVLLHYTDSVKPWHLDCVHPLKRHFLTYQTLSPWAQARLTIPTYKRMKTYAFQLKKEGNICGFIVWYLRYSWFRVINKLPRINIFG